uniref:NADH-ubiquinone oxidoreductase chain 3 n=1 Tax=Pygmaeconus traillii TaxID=1917173 RepID=A0A1L3N1X6_9COND|nr:NADH dehydrogenase subunit 3 [Pygmaeconus traillii]
MLSTILSSAVGIMLSYLVMLLGWLLSNRSISDREKSSPFECGFDPIKSSRIPFSLRFFLLAIIFLIFDIEIVLLFPILVGVLLNLSINLMFGMFIFLLVLVLGLFHEWNEGSLDWAK